MTACDHEGARSRDDDGCDSLFGDDASGDCTGPEDGCESLFGDGDAGDDVESLFMDDRSPALPPTPTSVGPSVLSLPAPPSWPRGEASQPPPLLLALPMPAAPTPTATLCLPPVLTPAASQSPEPQLVSQTPSPGGARAPGLSDVSTQDEPRSVDHGLLDVEDPDLAMMLEAELDGVELGLPQDPLIDFATSESGPVRDDQACPDNQIGSFDPEILFGSAAQDFGPELDLDLGLALGLDSDFGFGYQQLDCALQDPNIPGQDSAPATHALSPDDTGKPCQGPAVTYPVMPKPPRRVDRPEDDPKALVQHIKLTSTITMDALRTSMRLDEATVKTLAIRLDTFMLEPGQKSTVQLAIDTEDKDYKRLLLIQLALHFLRTNGNGEKYFGQPSSGDGDCYVCPLWPDDSSKLLCDFVIFLYRRVRTCMQRIRNNIYSQLKRKQMDAKAQQQGGLSQQGNQALQEPQTDSDSPGTSSNCQRKRHMFDKFEVPPKRRRTTSFDKSKPPRRRPPKRPAAKKPPPHTPQRLEFFHQPGISALPVAALEPTVSEQIAASKISGAFKHATSFQCSSAFDQATSFEKAIALKFSTGFKHGTVPKQPAPLDRPMALQEPVPRSNQLERHETLAALEDPLIHPGKKLSTVSCSASGQDAMAKTTISLEPPPALEEPANLGPPGQSKESKKSGLPIQSAQPKEPQQPRQPRKPREPQHSGPTAMPMPFAQLTYEIWLVDSCLARKIPALRLQKRNGLQVDGYLKVLNHCSKLGLEPVVDILTPSGLVAVEDIKSWDEAVDAVRREEIMEGVVKIRVSGKSVCVC